MRLWSVHPRYLDPQGLVALWREALLARAVLRGRTRGYLHHPQLDRFRLQRRPRAAISMYLRAVHAEAVERGYSFDSAKVGTARTSARIPVTEGQIAFEWEHLLRKLSLRSPARYRQWRCSSHAGVPPIDAQARRPGRSLGAPVSHHAGPPCERLAVRRARRCLVMPCARRWHYLPAPAGMGTPGSSWTGWRSELQIEVVDLSRKNISAFDYEHRNRHDDFEPLIARVLEFEQIIFASPVYWYAVCPPMKTFLDRLSDLLELPDLLAKGRRLRGNASSCCARPLKMSWTRPLSMPGGKPATTWACTTADCCTPTAGMAIPRPSTWRTSMRSFAGYGAPNARAGAGGLQGLCLGAIPPGHTVRGNSTGGGRRRPALAGGTGHRHPTGNTCRGRAPPHTICVPKPRQAGRYEMTMKFLGTWAVVFVLWMAGAYVVHGMLLQHDYAALSSMFRSEADAQRHFPLMVLAHVVLAGAFSWIYIRGHEARPWLPQGLRFGFAVALLTVIPTYIIYYVVQPMPGVTVAKQMVFDTIVLLVLGATAAFMNRSRPPA